MNLHHIAYAVRDTDAAKLAFKASHPKVEKYKFFEESQDVYITYLVGDSGPKIELVEPASEKCSVHKVLKNKNTEIYHLCYEDESFEKIFHHFLDRDYLVLTKPFKTKLYENTYCSHLYHPDSGIIEVMGKGPWSEQ